MKWAAGIFVAMLYLVWPYYTLLELTQAIQAADAPTINRLVDWDQLRSNLKAQWQAHLQNIPKTARGRGTDPGSGQSSLSKLEERMWSDGGLVDPSPTIDQAINGGFPWL
jgi:hypothetical protein